MRVSMVCIYVYFIFDSHYELFISLYLGSILKDPLQKNLNFLCIDCRLQGDTFSVYYIAHCYKVNIFCTMSELMIWQFLFLELYFPRYINSDQHD